MEEINTIAIDGPASSGKSTLGCLLADDLGYLYFDTGVMYRAVTLAAIRRDIPIMLDGEDVTWDIRQEFVNASVSDVSVYKAVRDAMTAQQRRIAMENKVVMVGRDIGTVVMPEADLKIYLDAPVVVRAHRRYQEIIERGEKADFNTVLKGLMNRDDIDSSRNV